MPIKEYVSKGQPDDISIILGEQIYAQRYYFSELRDICISPYSRELVAVSRYYLTVNPKIIVDFEQDPRYNKFYLEEKRKFFLERGIVYIPVFFNENPSPEQFAQRYRDEREVLVRGFREALEDQALLKANDKLDPIFNDPVILAYIDAETLRRCPGNVKGAARKRHLPRLKEEVINELRNLNKDGILALVRRHQQTAISSS